MRCPAEAEAHGLLRRPESFLRPQHHAARYFFTKNAVHSMTGSCHSNASVHRMTV